MKKRNLVLGLLFIVTIAFAQESSFYLTTEDLGDTSQARVECKDGSKILMKDVKIENSSIMGLLSDGKDESILTNQIQKLETVSGNQSLLVGTICSCVIGIVVQVATMEKKETAYTVEVKTNWPLTILGYGGGYLIGHMIGKSMPKWRKVYEADEFGLNHKILPLDIYVSKYDKKLFAGIGINF